MPQKQQASGRPEAFCLKLFRPAAFPPKSPAGMMSSKAIIAARTKTGKGTMVTPKALSSQESAAGRTTLQSRGQDGNT